MSQIPELWQGMTQSERDDFDLFGLSPPELDFNSLGEQYYLTGWQWFVRINQRRQSMGLAPTTALPSDLGVSALSSITLAAAALPTGPVTIEWPAGELPAGYGSSLFMAAHPTLALKTMTSRLAQVWSQFEPAGTTADITASVLSRFGSLPAGYKLFAWCYRVREDGVRSPAATTTTEIL